MPTTHRRLLAVAAAAVLLTVTAAPAAAARQDAGSAGAARFRPIVGALDGRTGPELMADSFVEDYVSTVPLDPTACARLGRHGRVVALPGVAETPPPCHLRTGDPVVAMPGASCSDVEEPPFFAVGEAAQRACAREFTAQVLASVTVAVDGGAPVEIIRAEFAVSPGQRTIFIPADNAGGFRAGPATFTAAGWAAVLPPLAPGTHTVHTVGRFVGQEDQPVAFDYTLIVSPGR